mmetsp:Transcript_32434/g.78772  ORF Transcript_32434/g.78772 Transcript_32434/m.78772 type:complete len:108 (+) Transcript_32434:2232-2555(+)
MSLVHCEYAMNSSTCDYMRNLKTVTKDEVIWSDALGVDRLLGSLVASTLYPSLLTRTTNSSSDCWRKHKILRHVQVRVEYCCSLESKLATVAGFNFSHFSTTFIAFR